MSLHTILEAIEAAGDEVVKEIETGAYQKAHEILADARLEAQQIQENACTAASQPAYRERARIIHKARLEAIQIKGNAREAFVDVALERTRGRLMGIRTDQAYYDILRRLTQETIDGFKGSVGEEGQIILMVDPRDQKVFDKVMLDLWIDWPVMYDINCWGGLVAKSADGQITIINTLEARLERAMPFLRRYLAARFESGQEKGEECLLTTMEMHASGQ